LIREREKQKTEKRKRKNQKETEHEADYKKTKKSLIKYLHGGGTNRRSREERLQSKLGGNERKKE